MPDVKATIRKEKGRTRLFQLKKHTIPIPIPNAIDTVILAHLPTLPYQFLKWKKAAKITVIKVPADIMHPLIISIVSWLEIN